MSTSPRFPPFMRRWHRGGQILLGIYVFVLFLLLLAPAGCEKRPVPTPPPAPHPSPSYTFIGPPAPTPDPSTRIKSGNTVLEVPPGSTLTLEHVLETDDTGPTSSFTRSAESSGASLSTSAPEIAADFDASAPTTSLSGEDGGNASGGDLSTSLNLRGMKPSNPLFWIGGLLFLGAGVLLYLKRITAAACAAGVAITLIACAAFPAFALILALTALVLGALVLSGNAAFLGHQADTFEKTTRDLLALNETLPADSRRLVKDKASTILTDTTKSSIKRIKRKYNLPSERP